MRPRQTVPAVEAEPMFDEQKRAQRTITQGGLQANSGVPTQIQVTNVYLQSDLWVGAAI